MKTLSRLNLIKFFGLVLVTLALSACSLTGSSSRSGLDSSVFLSTDGGNSWREAVTMSSASTQPQNIRSLNVNKMEMDPQDNLAVYLASVDNGLYYTYNVVQDGWLKAKNLPNSTIRSVQVDPQNKCIIYAATGNQVFSTQDCSRTWQQIYFDNNVDVMVNAIVIDHYNPRNLYIGTSRGEIIKSIDRGASWRTIRRLDEGISRMIISPLDSRVIFVASERNRIYSFISNTSNPADSGDIEANFVVNNWLDLNTVLKDFDLGRTFRDFVICKKDGKMFIATNQTILRSSDQGITWEKISLIQPEKDAVVNALAVDPQNSDNLFYVTNTTFFRSTDGGVTWSTRKLPTSSRAGRALLIDFENPNYIYLGTVKLK